MGQPAPLKFVTVAEGLNMSSCSEVVSIMLAGSSGMFLAATAQGQIDVASDAVASNISAASNPAVGPDLIVGGIYSTRSYGSVDGISAFSLGHILCNPGDEPVATVASTNQHPVFTQNMYRLNDGRFEQIGMSWVGHTFCALTSDACGLGCQNPGTCALLGVGCSDPYSAGINGVQTILGPRFEVDANAGFFQFPRSDPPFEEIIGRRLQVHEADLDPNQNGGGLYFAEFHCVAPDDAAAGNGNNNASYRNVLVTGSGDSWRLDIAGLTQREQPAIRAWQDIDPSVLPTDIQFPGEGFFILASMLTAGIDGFWHYEYALHNLNSDRSGAYFSVPLPRGATVQNVGFHDVDYHSGEPYDLTDWAAVVTDEAITWSTESYEINPNANALRWSTLYNFRFDVNGSPGKTVVTLGLFKPGTPVSVSTIGAGPWIAELGDLNRDGLIDLEDFAALEPCLGGPGVPIAPSCLRGDFNDDQDVDLEDIAGFQRAFIGG